MASTGLLGPFELTNAVIDIKVKKEIGAYALGYVNNNTFHVSYVGRDDDDLNRRLKEHVGSYQHFKFRHYNTAKEAYEKECYLYHDFTPRDNDIHPAKPDGTNYKCPVCGQ